MSTISPTRRVIGRGLGTAAMTLALTVGAVVALPVGTASAAPPRCAAAQPGGPVQVTPDCVDRLVRQSGDRPRAGSDHPGESTTACQATSTEPTLGSTSTSPRRTNGGVLLPVHLSDGLDQPKKKTSVHRGRPGDRVLHRERRLRGAGRQRGQLGGLPARRGGGEVCGDGRSRLFRPRQPQDLRIPLWAERWLVPDHRCGREHLRRVGGLRAHGPGRADVRPLHVLHPGHGAPRPRGQGGADLRRGPPRGKG